ncbi:MAG: hypothetical protein C4524_02390, partial [Candidatus Zixiibacteriota bacterium]
MKALKECWWLVICLLTLSSLTSAAEWVSLADSPEAYGVQVLESDPDRTVLRYTVNRYGYDEV